MKSKILGKDLMVFCEGRSIALATSHTLQVTANTTDTTTKDNGMWQSSEVTSFTWTMSSDNLVSCDTTDSSTYGWGTDKLFALWKAAQPVQLVFATTSHGHPYISDVSTADWVPNTSYVLASGNALITSINVNAANGDNATMSVSFQGVGELTLGDGIPNPSTGE